MCQVPTGQVMTSGCESQAFNRPSDYDSNATSWQLEILEEVFRTATPAELRELDLSWNFLRFVPFSFPCALPALTHLVFQNNYLSTLHLNTTCLQHLKVHSRIPSSPLPTTKGV